MTKNFAANLKIGAAMSSSVGRVFGGLNSKIKAQEATLKGLRAEYKLAAKGSGEFAGRLDQLKAKTQAAERELQRLRRAASFDIGKSLRGVGSAFGRDLRRAGIAGGIVGGVGLGVANNMLEVTAAFEKSLTILKTVEGSADKAQKSFSWIQDFQQKTPFELQQVTDAFVRLRAYGIDPIRMDSLRILGDTASAMGKDVMDAVEAIADAVTGENERLKEFGIKAAKEGGKIVYSWTDRNGKQLRKTVDANNRELIQKTLLAIWNSKYKGAMDEQSRTWNGMLSNIKDSWARFAYDVMQSGPFEMLKEQLGAFLRQLDVWSKDGTLKKWSEETGRLLVDTGRKIGDVIGKLVDGVVKVKDFVGGWQNLGLAILAVNFAPTVLAIASLTKGLYTLGAAAYAAAGPWGVLAGIITSIPFLVGDGDPGKGLALLKETLVENAKAIGDIFKGMADDFANWWGRNNEALAIFFEDLRAKIRTAMVRSAQDVKDAFTGVFDWIGQKFDELVGKAAELGRRIKNFFTFGGGGESAANSMRVPTVAPPEAMPGAEQRTANNTVNIKIDAPGQDGAGIARQLRQELNRKPLFDYDGALVPA